MLHSNRERDAYLEYNSTAKLVVSNTKADQFGLTRQREWVCNNLVRKGEWLVFADDNIREVRALVNPHYLKLSQIDEIENMARSSQPIKEIITKWRKLFRVHCSEGRLLTTIVPDTICHCQQVGAHLAGFSLTDNGLFRGNKFQDVAYIKGKLMIWHNTLEVPFDHTITMEDFYHTAEHLLRYGRAVLNNWCWPRAYHYEPGGLGRYAERAPHRQRDVQILLQRYRGLFRVKDRKGFAPSTDLQLAVTTKHIERWRQQMHRPRLF